MDQALIDLGDYAAAALPAEVAEIQTANDELIIHSQPDSLIKLLTFLRDDQNCQFKQLSDITGVDYPKREKRFEIVYNLLSHKHNLRVRVKIPADEDTQVPSACGLYNAAIWLEREVWDMYGDPSEGNYAGLPGKFFAKVNHDKSRPAVRCVLDGSDSLPVAHG